jgi:hypothetical protein
MMRAKSPDMFYSVLWIRICKDPKLFAGSGFETGFETYKKIFKQICDLIIMPLKILYSNIFFEKCA